MTIIKRVQGVEVGTSQGREEQVEKLRKMNIYRKVIVEQ